MGLPVILEDAESHLLVALVESLTDERYVAMTQIGHPELVLTRRRVEALGIQQPIQSDTLRFRVPSDRNLDWISMVAGQNGLDDKNECNGVPIPNTGKPIHQTAIGLAKTVQSIPAIVCVALNDHDMDSISGLGLTTMPLDLAIKALAAAGTQSQVSSAQLPMDAALAGHVHVFRPDNGGPEHYAIVIGQPDLSDPVSVRLHSACFTGDVLGSLKCDCGPQLRAAMATMASGCGGVLVYLNQEGRGIGLANKMRAYALQDAGLDTVEANHWLGFEDDQRDFRIGGQILQNMGINRVRLITNNPAKVASLAAQGVEVTERVPLKVGQTVQNAHYLSTKVLKSGHLL
ncbi:MAG: GTP cyclohydrolase II [Pelagibaca sp.]